MTMEPREERIDGANHDEEAEDDDDTRQHTHTHTPKCVCLFGAHTLYRASTHMHTRAVPIGQTNTIRSE